MHGRYFTTLALSLSLFGVAAEAQIVREGGGPRREAIDKMERTAFPSELWGELESWSTEEPLTAADLGGKAVLIVTWAGWYPSAVHALSVAQQMHEKYAGDGLVVVGIHHPQGFEGAEAQAKSRGVTFPYAHDTDGGFRKALQVDQDPDFYLVDRAGQLRYADIATGSVEDAVKELLEETREHASSLNDRLAEAARAAEQAFRQTERINQEVDLRELQNVSFDQPSEADWQAVQERWPEMQDRQGNRHVPQNMPVIEIPAEFPKYPEMPSTEGRAQVIYFWTPQMVDAEQYVLEPMNSLQRKHARDVVVLSVLAPQERQRSRDDAAQAELTRELQQVMERMARSGQLNHTLIFDPQAQILESIEQNRDLQLARRNSGSGSGLLPHALITDSAGRLRWFGTMLDPSFRPALDQVLRIDPGIRNRRQAEAEYIRTRSR